MIAGRVLALGLWLACTARAAPVAWDNADHDPYPAGFNPGDNAGYGFTPWVVLASGSPGAMFTTTAIDGGTYSWGMNGTYALGRGLSNSLAAGRFSLLALHASGNTAFSGFNLKTNAEAGFDADEVLRVGLDPAHDTGFSFSTNAGADYVFVDCGWVSGLADVLRYEIGWNDSGFSITVSNLAEHLAGATNGTRAGGTVSIAGMAVNGASTADALTFDDLTVDLEPSAVTLAAFSLRAEDGHMQVCWQTAAENQTLGFDVLRAAGATWVKVNPDLIPARGWPAGGQGAEYCLDDPAAQAGGLYHYRLVEYETDGGTREYGPLACAAPSQAPRLEASKACSAGLTLRWASCVGEVYYVWQSPDPYGPYQPLAAGLPATPPVNTWTGPVASGSGFYRLETRR